VKGRAADFLASNIETAIVMARATFTRDCSLAQGAQASIEVRGGDHRH